MKDVSESRTTARDREVLECVADVLASLARTPEERERFEAIGRSIKTLNVGYMLEAHRWERLNGVPWNGGAGVRVLAERGDPDALALLEAVT